MPETNETTQEIAQYSIYDIDKQIIFDIEKFKNSFVLSFYSQNSTLRWQNLNSIILAIKTLIAKYNDTYLADTKVQIEALNQKDNEVSERKYSFLDLERLALSITDINTQKIISENIFYIYSKFLKDVLKVALPTNKTNSKKNLKNRFLSILKSNTIRYNAINKYLYKPALDATGLTDSFFNYLVSLTTINKYVDIDFVIIISGFKRIGKSELALRFYSTYLAMQQGIDIKQAELLAAKSLEKVLVFSYENTSALNTLYKSPILFDEALLVADNRRAMEAKQVAFLELLNTAAYHHNVSLVLIQNINTIDKRITDTANAILHITERGDVYTFSAFRNYPYSDAYHTAYLNNLLSKSKIRFKSDIFDKLRRLDTYIDKFQYAPYSINNPLLRTYLALKANKMGAANNELATLTQKRKIPDLDLSKIL